MKEKQTSRFAIEPAKAYFYNAQKPRQNIQTEIADLDTKDGSRVTN